MKTEIARPRICVLICTFDRHAWLKDLLGALVAQANELDATIVVVDNGTNSAEELVEPFRWIMKVQYERLLRPGLSSARNHSLSIAFDLGADFFAFIDDDEVPSSDWLVNLLSKMLEENADIVQGPVNPIYDVYPPAWITESGLFVKSGTNFATSNLMLRSASLPKDRTLWFDPAFDFTGGEDNDFLRRLVRLGLRSRIAKNALVHEHVPAARMTVRYIYSRGVRDGLQDAKIIRKNSQSFWWLLVYLACACCSKAGYGLNHLLWSIVSPWRFNRAVADFASVVGIILFCIGQEFTFYGRRT